MEQTYTTPLAKLARILEIFIPGYMFGKAWGIADEKTVDLFRAQFPAFLVDMAEYMKHNIMATDNHNLQLLFATVAGAIVGFLVIVVLAIFMHLVLRDRAYIDSLRFTAVSLIPIAVLNGTLSHAVKTLLENMGTQSVEALTKSAVQGPYGNIALCVAFYMTALWMLGKRTGVRRGRRWGLIAVGLGFIGVYFLVGLSITPGEWQVLLPKLQQTLAK